MKIEHDNKLEKNDLAESLKSLAGKAKEGQFISTRFVGLLLLLAVVIGVWWYLRGTGRKSDSEVWRNFDSLVNAEGYEKFAEGHANSPAGRAARLQQARFLLAQGVPQLTTFTIEAESRKKALDSIESARDLFAKLADEFKDDLTLRAQSLEGAAKAELVLVGIPKAGGGPDDSRGSVKKAVDLYRDYAKTVGEKTPLGEQATKKAADLELNQKTILKLGEDLNAKYAVVRPTFDEPKAPGSLISPSNPLKSAEPTAPGKVETPSIPPPVVPGIPAPSTTPAPPPPMPTPPPPVSSKK